MPFNFEYGWWCGLFRVGVRGNPGKVLILRGLLGVGRYGVGTDGEPRGRRSRSRIREPRLFAVAVADRLY